MASAQPPPSKRSPGPSSPHAAARPRSTRPAGIVDPLWLAKAGAVVLAFGVLCAYGMVCALFYTQQWQFVLHPSRVVPEDPGSVGLSFQPVRFGDDSSGQPQLTGWWIPGDLPTDPTVLMLHGQDGSMSDALLTARELHDARLNLLLFDYRGYGKSGGRHPSETLMQADAKSALLYLTQTRGLRPSTIVVYGSGLASSLAVGLCQQFDRLPALILESADGDTESRVMRDNRAHIVPVRLLFRERFPLADALHALRTPKLLISFTGSQAPVEAQRAADPKTTVELPPGTASAEITAAVRRFLGTYVPHPPSLLVP